MARSFWRFKALDMKSEVVGPTLALYLMVLMMSNMVGIKNKGNRRGACDDLVMCGRSVVVAVSDVYERKRTEA